jgi:hypothetical protein
MFAEVTYILNMYSNGLIVKLEAETPNLFDMKEARTKILMYELT